MDVSDKRENVSPTLITPSQEQSHVDKAGGDKMDNYIPPIVEREEQLGSFILLDPCYVNDQPPKKNFIMVRSSIIDSSDEEDEAAAIPEQLGSFFSLDPCYVNDQPPKKDSIMVRATIIDSSDEEDEAAAIPEQSNVDMSGGDTMEHNIPPIKDREERLWSFISLDPCYVNDPPKKDSIMVRSSIIDSSDEEDEAAAIPEQSNVDMSGGDTMEHNIPPIKDREERLGSFISLDPCYVNDPPKQDFIMVRSSIIDSSDEEDEAAAIPEQSNVDMSGGDTMEHNIPPIKDREERLWSFFSLDPCYVNDPPKKDSIMVRSSIIDSSDEEDEAAAIPELSASLNKKRKPWYVRLFCCFGGARKNRK